MNNFTAEQAQAIFLIGKRPIGIVLLHGFTSVPGAMDFSARSLHKAGYSVYVPLLPGHGTRWQDLNNVSWTDWSQAVDQAVFRLRRQCKRVFLFGLSLGGLLALHHTQHNPDIAGSVVINPVCRLDNRGIRFLPLLKYFVAHTKGIASDIRKSDITEPAYDCTPLKGLAELVILMKMTCRNFHEIRSPLLMFQSSVDHVIPDKCHKLEEITKCRVVRLVNSYHVAVMDEDKELIIEQTLQFIESLTRKPVNPEIDNQEQVENHHIDK
ncbi:MAG: alpha/beta fold hydrolase [Candidatus Cloacimonetes bacterium]|nr:alpha/beta fold hydrolase [Candidatus Cloacimonadota bacterium]